MSTWQIHKSLAIKIYLPSFLMSICQGSVILAIPLYALDLGSDTGVAAFVFAMRGLGNMAVDVPAGYATSRWGDRTVMLLGVGLMALCAWVSVNIESALQLSLAAFVFGAAMAMWLLARLSHIRDAIPHSHRGRAISTMAGLQRFGNVLGPVCTGIVADQFGFDAVFGFVFVLAIIAWLVVVSGVKTNRKTQNENPPGILRLLPFILSKHRTIFMTAGSAVFILTLLRAGRQLLIPLWGEHIGISTTDIGIIVSLASAVDMMLFPVAGHLMDNYGRKYSAVSCLAIMSFGVILVPFTASFSSLLVVAAIAGAGNGMGSGINMTLGADFAPTSEQGEFLGVWRLLSDTGSFTGPLAIGYISNVMYLSSAFYLTGLLGIIGVLVMFITVRETLEKS